MASDSLNVLIEIHRNIQAAYVYFFSNPKFDTMEIEVKVNQIFVELKTYESPICRMNLISPDKLFMPSTYYSQSGTLIRLNKGENKTLAKYERHLDGPSFRLQLRADSPFIRDDMLQHIQTETLTEMPQRHVKTGVAYNIVCSCCNLSFTNAPVTFTSISTLPFDYTELYENLFCHRFSCRAGECSSQSSTELFVSSTSYVLSCLNANSLNRDVGEGISKCKQCSSVVSWVKRHCLERFRYSIFCFKDKIKFNVVPTSNDASQNNNEFIGHGLYSLIDMIYETLRLSLSCKLYLEAKEQILENAVLVWVVDSKMKHFKKDLPVSRLKPVVEYAIEFQYVIKVLFRVTTATTDLARSWMHDFSVDCHYVSDTMILTIIEYLHRHSYAVPDNSEYPRGFLIGYLPVKL